MLTSRNSVPPFILNHIIMKNILTALTLSLITILPLRAQDSVKVVPQSPQLEDVLHVLEIMDVHLYNFDLTAFLDDTYEVRLYIDEYEAGKERKRLRTQSFGKNICTLKDYPEQDWTTLRDIYNLPEGTMEWTYLSTLRSSIHQLNDSTARFTISNPGRSRYSSNLKLKPIAEYNRYAYNVRPFKLKPAVKGAETVSVPLLLYGSSWLDTRYNVIRFCGEKEIDPEMQATILQHLPHYYVIGIVLKKVQEE